MTPSELQQIEFFRDGMALLPEPSDKRPGIAFFVPGNDYQLNQRFCTCNLSKSRTCPHLKHLTSTFKSLHQKYGRTFFEDHFRSSIWYQLAAILGEDSGDSHLNVIFRTQKRGEQNLIKAESPNGETLVQYLSQNLDRVRFLERCAWKVPDEIIPHRGWVLSRLADITRTDNEKSMNAQGFKTRKQVLEASFWFRCAYHCFLEFEAISRENNGCTFEPAISEKTGAFTVSCLAPDRTPLIRLFIPRNKVRKLLSTFQEHLPNQHALTIHPIPLKSIFKISPKYGTRP
jgi:hypothetical protein